MNIVHLLKVFAEVNDITYFQAKSEWDNKKITPYELIDCWLHYEGIVGYTQVIVTAFRAAYGLD